MLRDTKRLCRRIVDDVWNGDNYAVLAERRSLPLIIDDSSVDRHSGDLLDLIALITLVKAFLPNVRLQTDGESQYRDRLVITSSARGRHDGLARGITPTHRRVKLQITLIAYLKRGAVSALQVTWDSFDLARQVGAQPATLRRMLRAPLHEITVRAIWRSRGVPTVFVPPMSLPGWVVWRRSLAALQRRHPVVTCDLIATRRALRRFDVSRHYNIKTETHAIGRALRIAGITGPIDLVGHSAGGTIALDFALDNPTAIRSLTLIEPGAAWVLKAVRRFDDEMRQFVRDRLTTYARPVTRRRYEAFLRQSFLGPRYVPSESPLWPMLCAYMHNLQFRPALYRHSDRLQRLAAAPFPVLLVAGTESDRFHREVVAGLASVLPHVEVVNMPGGHAPHLGAGLEPFHRRLIRFQYLVSRRASAA